MAKSAFIEFRQGFVQGVRETPAGYFAPLVILFEIIASALRQRTTRRRHP